MSSDKFELTDVSDPKASSNSETNLTMGSGRRGGCFVSSVVAVVLVVLAVVLVVAVGLIVYFAGDGRDVVCKCGAVPGSDALTQKCEELADEGHPGVCSKCNSDQSPTQDTGGALTPTPRPSKVRDVRLPRSLTAIHYDLIIQPYMHSADPKDFTFKGKVRLQLECKTPTDNVTLHANVLRVSESSIKFYAVNPGTSDPSYTETATDSERQFFILLLDKPMKAGQQYVVEMEFTSPLKDDLKGLYYSSYVRDNKTVYLATTQFAPTDARRAFPCMDEPAFKATFNITLVRPSHLISIANTPIIDSSNTWQEDGIEYIADVYQKTPKMSTYLLAFIFCDFQYTHNNTERGIEYRAWSRKEAKNSTLYALSVGVQILSYFEDYFQIPYPLPKQDMIAIPDFAAGAMENWGLITYRETAMLYEPGVSNEKNRERVASVVSHELAHQWFGDLVTPAWWDDVWLNEGFASFVEYLGVDHVHPDWKMFDRFVTIEVQDVFDFDGLVSSHPIYVPVAHQDEINEIFDRISYGKGASVLRMLRHFLGFETFRKGVINYLKARAYDAAFHDDLWAALTKEARSENKNIDVKSIMDTWTLQMNFPVVMVSRDLNQLDSIHVSQRRYLRDRSAKDPGVFHSPFGYTWSIPLTLTSSKNPRFDHTDQDVVWMYRNETEKTFSVGEANLPDAGDESGWILANVQQHGFYRVNYQTGNWKALAMQLKTNHKVIPVTNRAQIINDVWNLAKSGDLQLDIGLMMIEYLVEETDYIPWFAARKELTYVRRMLSLSPANGPFENFLHKMSRKAYQVLGLNNKNSTHTEILGRALIARLACDTNNPDCLKEASRLFKQWMSKPEENPIDPDLKLPVYCNAVRMGDWEEWNFALQMYLASSVASERANLLYAMACSQKPWILNNYLNMILEENSPIRRQDFLNVISYIAVKTIGRPLAWNFFRANYDTLSAQFGNSFFSWSSVIGWLTTSFNTDFDLNEIKQFLAIKKGTLGTGERAFQQAIEKTQSNIIWMRKNEPVIRKWLRDGGY